MPTFLSPKLNSKPNQLRDLKCCAMRMSSYLLALAVGRFDTIQAERTTNEPTVGRLVNARRQASPYMINIIPMFTDLPRF